MRRQIRELISLEALKHLCYTPVIISKIRNWDSFLLNYIGFRNQADLYTLRNGIRIKTNEGIDTATIALIFMKKEYGTVGNNATIIDIGANIGVFSIFAASTSENTKVYAYEPMPRSYDLLLENIELNGLNCRIMPFQLGIAAKKEKRRLFLASASPFHSFYCTEGDREFLDVSVISLKDVFDEHQIEHCDILKSDCEGAEFEILYNTPTRYLERIKEIRLEYHNLNKEKYDIKDLVDFLVTNGFKLTSLRRDNRFSGNAWFKRI